MNEAPLIALGRLSIRPSVGAGLNPVARIGEQLMLSFLPVGSISLQTYGYRLISAIGGTVFFRSVVVTVVPRLTTATARGDDDAVRRLAGLAVRLMLAISVPLTVFLAILGRPNVDHLPARQPHP